MTYARRDLFKECSESLHGTGGLLVAIACVLLLPVEVTADVGRAGLPPVAIAATIAAGLGALCATLLYSSVERTGVRILVLAVSLPVIAWACAAAFGLHHPAQGSGLVALWLIGVALVPATPGSQWIGLARAGALVLLGFFLDGAPAAWGLFQETPPWSPEVAARLLDASPRTFALEIAGFDWMRHPAVYEAVGTDRISPSLRQPYGNGGPGAASWRQAVAVLPLLVVGSTATALRLFARRSQLSANPR